jgi:hypothetical protein
MNTDSTKKVIITATATAICLGGSWIAGPAQAKTDLNGCGTGGGDAASSSLEIDEIVALRKEQMARDYVANAAARADYAARGR